MTSSELKDFYAYLKMNQVVKNQTEFAKRLGKSRQYVAEAMNETEKLTDFVVQLVTNKFKKEWPEWRRFAEEYKYKDIYVDASGNIQADIDRKMGLLEELVESKNEIIRLKDGYIEDYKSYIAGKITLIEAYLRLHDRRIDEIYAKLFDQPVTDVKAASDEEFQEILKSLKQELGRGSF